MTSTEPSEHLHLVSQRDAAAEAGDLGELWSRRARDHGARADLLAAQRDAEALAEARHAAYMAEGRRRLERLQLDQALEVAAWSRVDPPPGAWPRTPPDDVAVSADEQDVVGRHHQEPGASLDDAARELFDRQPDAGRQKVMEFLGVNEYTARTLVQRHKPAAAMTAAEGRDR